MKKLCAVFAGILLFFVITVGFKFHMNAQMYENSVGLRDWRGQERFLSSEAQKHIIEDNTLVVFGSSELVPLGDYSQTVASFLNGKEMNIMTIGTGYFQSLSHAMSLGSLAESIPSKKVALFLSPQWFGKDGIQPDAFASRMSENELLDFLCNKSISKESKLYVIERLETLLAGSPSQLERVRKYSNAVENPISLDAIYMGLMNLYWDYRAEFDVYRQLDMVNNDVPFYDLSQLNFDEILSLAQEQGEASCTNNDFAIKDDYWDTYVKETYEMGEITDKIQVYTDSPEYEDLRLFLNVAEELDIQVILVSIPVHKKWYAYRGELCDAYYENIREVAKSYTNVCFVDMSIYDGEEYFLRDVMHLGWKGWARINEALYSEFTQ